MLGTAGSFVRSSTLSSRVLVHSAPVRTCSLVEMFAETSARAVAVVHNPSAATRQLSALWPR